MYFFVGEALLLVKKSILSFIYSVEASFFLDVAFDYFVNDSSFCIHQTG